MASTAPLIRSIEVNDHTRHLEQLTRLAEMAERVETVHFGDNGVPEGLACLLEGMIGRMETQPVARGSKIGEGRATAAAMVVGADEVHAADVAEIRRLTENLVLPEGACGLWTALYVGLAEFMSDVDSTQHPQSASRVPPVVAG